MAVPSSKTTMDVRDQIVADILSIIEQKETEPYMMALGGSSRHDIDIFVVLSDGGSFHKSIRDLHNAIQTVQQNLLEDDILLSVFPENNIKIADKYLSKLDVKSENLERHIQLHLLVYPTYELFVEWEGPMLVKRVTKSSDILLGNGTELREKADNLQTPNFKNRVCSPNLLMVLMDNYQILKCGKYPDKIHLEEVTDKTAYVIRYLAFDYLLEQEYGIEELLTWDALYKKIDSLDSPLNEMLEIAYQWWQTDEIAEKEVLEEINDECLTLIESEISDDD